MAGKTFNFDNIVSPHKAENIKILDNFVDTNKLPIQEIDSSLLDTIDNQPFYEYNDDNLNELKDSINENGLLSPLVVNKKDGRYKILAGRNRFRACQLLGWSKIPCNVLEVEDTQERLILVDSNLNQRHELLPSEKARAYKIKIECLSEIQGTTYTQAVENLSNSENVTKRNIFRYLKLAQLSDELLASVDEGLITLTAGIVLVDFEKQDILAEYLSENKKKVNDKTAASLIELQQYEDITYTVLDDFFNKKPEKARKNIKVDFERLSTVITDSNTMSDEQLEDYIINALDFYKLNHNSEE